MPPPTHPSTTLHTAAPCGPTVQTSISHDQHHHHTFHTLTSHVLSLTSAPPALHVPACQYGHASTKLHGSHISQGARCTCTFMSPSQLFHLHLHVRRTRRLQVYFMYSTTSSADDDDEVGDEDNVGSRRHHSQAQTVIVSTGCLS